MTEEVWGIPLNTEIKTSRSNKARIISLALVLSLTCAGWLTVPARGESNFKIGTSNSYTSVDAKKAFVRKVAEEIIGIDISAYGSIKYTINNLPYVVGSVPYNETDIIFALCRGKLKTDVLVRFVDNKFEGFNLYSNYFYGKYNAPPSPPLLKNKSAIDAITVANDVLSKYKPLLNASYIDHLMPLLNRLSPMNSSQKISDNDVTLSYSRSTLEPQHTSIYFEYSVEGIPSQCVGLCMSISEDGYLTALADTVSLFRIGSTTVSIQEEDAVQMDLSEASQCSNSIGAKIDKTEAKLSLMHSRGGDGLVLYPYWAITFTFDKFYPQFANGPKDVNGYFVGIWADTGEIADSNPQAWYAGKPVNTTSSLLFIPLLCIVAVTTLTLFRRKNKNNKKSSKPI